MAIYSISYDLKRVKNYPLLYGRLQSWGGKRLLLSQWMVDIAVPALTVVQILSQYIDGDDALAVLEVSPGADWATLRAQRGGIEHLRRADAWASVA